jgi:hypothetical protein
VLSSKVPPLRGTLASKAFFCNNFHSLNWERIHLPQLTAAQELQIKAQKRLASLMEEKLVTRISVLSTLLGGAKQPNDFSSLPACVPISLEYRQHRAKQQDVAMAVERGRVQTVPRNEQTRSERKGCALCGRWIDCQNLPCSGRNS